LPTPYRPSRRDFLTTAGGATLASLALPAALRQVLAQAKPQPATMGGGPLPDIRHVVILMQENRSFDHYFGAFPGVRGFADTTVPKSRFYQPDSQNPDGYLLPFHADSTTSAAQQLPSNSHEWTAQHDSWNNGDMNGFVTAHLESNGDDGQYTMAYLTGTDIPFHWALADAFTICDAYHCSMLGPTWPNRLYLMSGTVNPAGNLGGPIYGNYVPPGGYRWKSYPEMLTDAGVSWRVYQENDNYGMNVLEYFTTYTNASTNSPLYQNALKIYNDDQFEFDAINDRLPTVSWIIPTSFQSEHPNFLPAAGADFVASKVAAIAANPDVWAKTLFIMIYDENDGFFDHVTPPTPPAGTPGEYIEGLPIGLGFRVPAILVSPWTVGGYVSHDTLDHTSSIRLLERITGVMNPNLTAWRRKTVGDFSGALGRRVGGRFPRLPGTKRELILAEEEVRTLQLPPIPKKHQTFPQQSPARRPVASGLRSAVNR
jgi:phospholipase C